MHFIIGTIILALFILAIRVIWHSLKTVRLWFTQRWGVWQSQRVRHAAVRPALLPARFTAQPALSATDWEDVSHTVRQSLLERNTRGAYRLEQLDIELQAKLKTQAILQADIEITELQHRLLETQAMLAQPVKRRRNAPQESTAKKPFPKQALRKALNGGEKGKAPSIVH